MKGKIFRTRTKKRRKHFLSDIHGWAEDSRRVPTTSSSGYWPATTLKILQFSWNTEIFFKQRDACKWSCRPKNSKAPSLIQTKSSQKKQREKKGERSYCKEVSSPLKSTSSTSQLFRVHITSSAPFLLSNPGTEYSWLESQNHHIEREL